MNLYPHYYFSRSLILILNSSFSLFGEIDEKLDKKIRKADDGIESLRQWIFSKSQNFTKVFHFFLLRILFDV
jgi:hypothetical protein